MPQPCKVHEPHYPHFVTSTIVHLIPVFRRDEYFRVLTNSLNYCVEHRGLRIHAFVVMPDHTHLIRSHLDGDISGVIRDIKRFTSRQLYELLV